MKEEAKKKTLDVRKCYDRMSDMRHKLVFDNNDTTCVNRIP